MAFAQLILRRGSRVLLTRHERGAFAGRWTGLLARSAPGEAPIDTALRAASAVGVRLPREALQLRAVFQFLDRSSTLPDAGEAYSEHEFLADQPEGCTDGGEPRSSADVTPAWHAADALPFAHMPADDAHWYPLLLRGALLVGRFEFGAANQLTLARVTRVDALPAETT